jgi:hypothetical protein
MAMHNVTSLHCYPTPFDNTFSRFTTFCSGRDKKRYDACDNPGGIFKTFEVLRKKEAGLLYYFFM